MINWLTVSYNYEIFEILLIIMDYYWPQHLEGNVVVGRCWDMVYIYIWCILYTYIWLWLCFFCSGYIRYMIYDYVYLLLSFWTKDIHCQHWFVTAKLGLRKWWWWIIEFIDHETWLMLVSILGYVIYCYL